MQLSSPQTMRQAGQQLPLIPDETVMASQPPVLSSSPEPLPARDPSQQGSHGRDHSIARGRPVDAQGFGATLQAQSLTRSQSTSKSPEPGLTRSVSATDGEVLEKRPHNHYGHHRQASIVHGTIQHSRNTSLALSTSTGSMSSEVIPAGSFGTATSGDSRPNAQRETSPLSTLQDVSPVEAGAEPPFHRRNTSSKSRREHGHGHHHSLSRSMSQEARTVEEFALHHLFNSFVGLADEKINQCILSMGELETPVEHVCGPGADPGFDQLISALGHIAKQKPRPLIDTVMFWRKSKGDAATLAKQTATQPKQAFSLGATMIRRNTEFSQIDPDYFDTASFTSTTAFPMVTRHEEVVVAERRATVSVYLVCRVLIEIFNQSTIDAITRDMADRLEDIVFGQLKSVDPDQIAVSPLRMANWRIYGQLLGIMSETNFTSVTTRFLAELSSYQKEEGRMLSMKDAEARAELLIYGMKHMQLQTYPEEAWNKTCDFIYSLAKMFVDAHGQRLKQAYCQMLELFLLPIASNPVSNLTTPKWKEFLELVGPRLGQNLVKSRNGNTPFSLQVLLLCTSPKDTFLSQWMSSLHSLAPKLKDRPTRAAALQGICRLLWTYLYRYSDTLSNPLRKVEEIIRFTLPTGKKNYMSTDPAVVDPITQLVRIIGFRYPDICFRMIIFPLVNSEIFMSGKELKIEQMEPEKMVMGIRSFLALIADLESEIQQPPPFPQDACELSLAPFAGHILPTSLDQIPADSVHYTYRPVNSSRLNDGTRKSFLKFSEVLGKLTILCDNTFGGQAVLDEKFGSTVTPKTPITEHFSFGRRDDHTTIIDQKQAFYDLLHVAVQALPRCLSDHIPFNSLINLLCTGTAHVQSNIAASSAESLKSIARQSHAQHVAIGFARFIFNFDARYATMSDEGMLGPGHIESTLTLYVELIQIWIEEIKQKQKEASAEHLTSGSRGLQLDLSSVLAYVEEIESHGLFFLCSQSRRVRAFAITVLRLVTEFDSALGKDNTRIIRILEGDSEKIMDLKDDSLTVAERSRLQKGKQGKGTGNTVIELCSSEVSYDSTLWSKLFPNLIRICFDVCPFAVTLGREIVCARLVQMHKYITAIAEGSQSSQYGSMDYIATRQYTRSPGISSEVTIEQWKLYLVMACTTLNSAGAQSQSQLANAQHARKTSKSGQQSDKINSARALFAFVIPLLSASHESIRNAIVAALGSININLYRTLLESLQYAVTTCNEEARIRIGNHHRTPSSPRRNRQTDRLRTEVTNVYKATAHFLKDPEIYNEDWILNNLVTYARDLRIFLSDVEIQSDLEFQSLRFHYCGLMEQVFEGVKRSKDSFRWMPFESRKSAFSLMEDWCGNSPNQAQINEREMGMRKLALVRQMDQGEIRSTAAMEIEKRNLRTAALSAMASLCGGPIRVMTESLTVLQFDVKRMLLWIDIILKTASDKLHTIGRRALKNLIVHNKEYPYLLEQCIEGCYLSEYPKALESYFEVFSEVLTEHADHPVAFWRVLSAVLLTLGNSKREIRMKSARLLRTIEERQQKNSRLQDFDISISDKTTAVYKLAQFETSRRLAQQHADLAFVIFSEFSLHFKDISPDTRRNMVAAILPWIQVIELQLDPIGGPTAQSYMLLANLFEITIHSGGILPNEVQALWQALATGPHAGNVQLVLDFIINLCLERKEQNFVDYAKQIVVFLASTPAGSRVIDFFLMQITPKSMVHERREPLAVPPEVSQLPYVADLGMILPVGNKQAGLSLGQVSMIFLVDLMVTPVILELDYVMKLVHVALIFWDHYMLTVQEQAREMLVHLIHELVASKLDLELHGQKRQEIEDLVECIRKGDSSVSWDYDDNNGKQEDHSVSRVPPSMIHVTNSVADIFGTIYEGVGDIWSREALNWATSCPVRHLACRSFQVFRCISTSLDSKMLADMLARLSNTIAEEETDYQTFSMEILTTLKIIISSLAPPDLLRFPQLFWTTCACLNTIHEREFMESMAMLDTYIDKIDLADEAVVSKLDESKPPRWEGSFDGIEALAYKGLKSSESLDKTLQLLHKLALLPNSDLLGDSNRLLFAVWANMPGFLHYFCSTDNIEELQERAKRLGTAADDQGFERLSACLVGFAQSKYQTSERFLSDVVDSIATHYFPSRDVQSFVFVMGLLTNNTRWFRIYTMEILGLLISKIDIRRSDIACHGPDLISPLLRLLHTDLCPQALDVLDKIMTVSGNPMERHHLRMSMASSTSSRAIRKEFERIQSLYGIPEPTGWSIAVPAAQSGITRNNVHAVFYTCAEVEDVTGQPPDTPEMEFQIEDYGDSFFPTVRADTMKSFDVQTGNMGDLLQKLDSLDDFFDEAEDACSPLNSMAGSTLRSFTGDFPDASAHLYDQQTAPILRKSLARNGSTSSFHNGFAESRPSTGQRAETPQLHSSPLTSSVSTTALSGPPRSSLHVRSVTSPNTFFPPMNISNVSSSSLPPMPQSADIKSRFASDDYLEDALSDSDERLTMTRSSSASPRITHESPFSLEGMIKNNVRRLTNGGGLARDKERQREFLRAQHRAPAHSPRVPKVPAEYLMGSNSMPTSPGRPAS